MAIKTIASGGCSEKQLETAIFEETKLIKTALDGGIATQPLYMFKKFKKGKPVNNNENSNVVEKRNSMAGVLPFQQVDTSLKPNVEGQMTAKGNCSTANIRMGAVVNPVDPQACNKKVGIVDFGHGYFFKGFQDFEIQFATKERCMDELSAYDPQSVMKIFRDERRSFVNTGIQSLDHHYINYAITNGQANASVTEMAKQPNVILTPGGWHTRPTRHVSVSFLESHAMQIAKRKLGKNEITMGGMDSIGFEYEMTSTAWQIACTVDNLRRSAIGGVVDDASLTQQIRITGTLAEIKKSYFSKGALKSRGFYKHSDNVTIIFNEFPVRGYLKSAGKTTDGKEILNFVRIFHLKNVRADSLPYGQNVEGYDPAGLVSVENEDYFNTHICDNECEGGEGEVLELIPAIEDGAFSVHDRSNLPSAPGTTRHPVNFSIKLLDKGYLSDRECPNRFDEWYSLAARNRHRIVNRKTEYAGFIIHIKQELPQVDVPRNLYDIRCKAPQEEACVTMDKLDDPEYTQCEDGCAPDKPCTEVINLDPCGDISALWFGKEKIIPIKVTRGCAEGCDGDPSKLPATEIEYSVSDLVNTFGNSSVDGEHYCVVDEDGNAIDSAGTLKWEAGDDSDKYICVKLKDALPDIEPEEPTDKCCNELEPTPQPTLINVEITGDNVECGKSVISVQNLAE